MNSRIVFCTALFFLYVPWPATGAPLDPADPNDHWASGFHIPGCRGYVFDLITYRDELVVAGEILTVGGVLVQSIAAWNGECWSTMAGGFDSGVGDMIVWRDNLVAAGWFAEAGGIPADRIASWDGDSWQPLASGIDGWSVQALAVYDGDLFAAGQFWSAGGVQTWNIARWDGKSWAPVGGGINGDVYTLEIYQGKLIAGGHFNQAGGIAVANIAGWDGTGWSPLGAGTNDTVYSLTVHVNQGEEQLIAGGQFTRAGDRACSHIAAWDGMQWEPLGSGTDNTVLALTTLDKALVAGGDFHEAGGVPVSAIAFWDGVDWHQMAEGMATGSVEALGVWHGSLLAGGSFETAGPAKAYNLAAWDGRSWSPFIDGDGMGAMVADLTIHDGRLAAVGDFHGAGTTPACGVALWDGKSWEAIPGCFRNGPYTPILTSVASFQGSIVVGGSFQEVDGVYAHNIAAWDGSRWSPLTAGTDGIVWGLTVYRGDLIVGGNFTRIGYQTIQGVARYDGANWYDMGGGLSNGLWDAYASCFTELEGNLVVGGFFTVAGGRDMGGGIALWDGASWVRLLGDEMVIPGDLTVWDGMLVAAGSARRPGENWRVVVLREVGSSWQQIGEVTGTGAFGVGSLAVYDGRLYVAGHLDHVDGIAASGIARFDGQTWMALGSGIPTDYQIYLVKDLQVWRNHLMVGGRFGLAGNKPSRCVARWDARLPMTHPEPPTDLMVSSIPFTAVRTAGGVRLAFRLPRTSEVRLDIHDAGGRRIRTFPRERQAAGDQVITWDGRNEYGRDVAPGAYYARLRAGSLETTRTVLLVR